MQTAKQLSVSLVNKPGRLVAMLAALNKGKVNFRALSVMDSGNRGTVRFIPENLGAAVSVLEGINVRAESTDVLVVDVPSHPGAFRKICERLAADHLNIDYAYCSFTPGKARGGVAVIKVNDLLRAQKVLGENGSAPARRNLPIRRPARGRM